MNNLELSQQFDLLYNNLASDQAPPLNSYEVSVFLTKAQLEIVKQRFLPTGNFKQTGIDDSHKRQVDLSELIKMDSPKQLSTSTYDIRGTIYSLPEDYFLMLNEQVIISTGSTLVVCPIKYDEYNRIMMKPYHEPYKKQAWRINHNNSQIEIIPHTGETVLTYRIRYVKRPQPIILEDLEDGLSIEGLTKATECELNPEVHSEIVDRAVFLAKAFYLNNDANEVLQINQGHE